MNAVKSPMRASRQVSCVHLPSNPVISSAECSVHSTEPLRRRVGENSESSKHLHANAASTSSLQSEIRTSEEGDREPSWIPPTLAVSAAKQRTIHPCAQKLELENGIVPSEDSNSLSRQLLT